MELIRLDQEAKERFWSKVDIGDPDECWEWRRVETTGYGCWRYKGKNYRVHRVAFMLKAGPIPEDKLVLHLCHNPACCNVAHLRIGTQKQNMMHAQRRGSLQNQARGENNGGSKLKELDVHEIRRLYKTGDISQRRLSRMFRVGATQIGRIIRRQKWKHI